MITCSQVQLGVDGGCSLNIRINGQSSETSFILLLRSNVMQANKYNKHWRSVRKETLVNNCFLPPQHTT